MLRIARELRIFGACMRRCHPFLSNPGLVLLVPAALGSLFVRSPGPLLFEIGGTVGNLREMGGVNVNING
jgi:hypothetical protein